MAILVLALFAYIVQGLYALQVRDHARYAVEAAQNQYRQITVPPLRGEIVDRNGKELVFSSVVETFGMTPRDVKSRSGTAEREEIAAAIARILDIPEDTVLADMAREDATWIELKRRVGKEQADAMKAYFDDHEVGGISIDREYRRVYPEGRLAAQVLGFVTNDGIGTLGIEYQYNRQLTGEPGFVYALTDNYSYRTGLPDTSPVSLAARDGANLVLTLDIGLQRIAEAELKRSVDIYSVREGGLVLVMDPYTGDILAMAQNPDFDPAAPAARPIEWSLDKWNPSDKEEKKYLGEVLWRNRAITDTYEPGSTFKAFTAAIALEENLAREDEIFDDRPVQVADYTIHCWKKPGHHGLERLDQAFWNSCNPVFVELSRRIGIDRFYSYVRSFGFMGTTGIDLPGEGTGLMHETPGLIDMACLAFGEQSTVTPVALLTAYCAFANGGALVRPRIVKAVTDANGAVLQEYRTETVRRVVSEQTATRIRNLMEGVVLHGTGSAGYVEGYGVAGKTSKSERDDDEKIISFAALAPADQPVLCILVVLSAADRDLTSAAAAQTTARILSSSLEYLGVPREYTDKDVSLLIRTTPAPDLAGMTYLEARRLLAEKGFQADAGRTALGDDSLVGGQWPAAGTPLHRNARVALYPGDPDPEDFVTVPDVSGKTVHEAIRAFAEAGVNLVLDGDCFGTAVAQAVPAGEQVLRRTPVAVTFHREPAE